MTPTQTIEALQKFAAEHAINLQDLDIKGVIQDAIDDGIYALNILEPEAPVKSDREEHFWQGDFV